jgi:hypothetical protein
MKVTRSGQDLAKVIAKAIEDSVMTINEYEEIMSIASQDSHIDNHERALLKQLNALIAEKIVVFKKME